MLHSSQWPVILQTDSTASRGVILSAKVFGWAGLFCTLLQALTAIVTPFGLYEEITPTAQPALQAFHYIRDPGIFGAGTMPRDPNVLWSRICSSFSTVYACPSSTNNLTYFSNATGTYLHAEGGLNSTIKLSSIELFSSGAAALGPAVASAFDIQWRSWSYDIVDIIRNVSYDRKKPLSIGTYRPISLISLDNKIQLVEGLVVDTIHGGIGFRNHTAPSLAEYGMTWSEDLLFVEPLMQCVDTNLTVDFKLPENQTEAGTSASSTPVNVRLVDHGGFTNLPRIPGGPRWNRDSDLQNNPQLWERAYRAAWFHNAFAAAFLNVTNARTDDPGSKPALSYMESYIGKEFPLDYRDFDSSGSNHLYIDFKPQTIKTERFGDLFYGLDESTNNFTYDPARPYNFTDIPQKPALYPNPWNINETFWSDIGKSEIMSSM
jgi:hypothetical protein